MTTQTITNDQSSGNGLHAIAERSRRLLLMTVGLIALFTTGCSNLRLPAIDSSGSCLFAPLPTTTSLVFPGCLEDGSCSCLGCVRKLGTCLKSPCLGIPNPAFPEPEDPPQCVDPNASIGSGVANTGPCVPGPGCSGDCLTGPPAVLYGTEINATKACQLPSRGDRGCILLTPQKIVAPVGGEVMLLSGICGTDGYLLTGEPLEWMMTQDSVGHIIEVGDDDPGFVHRLAKIPEAKKETPGFARGVTSTKEMVVTRGNSNAADDIKLEKGQTYITVSSPSEGTSHVTVLAPDSDCWDQRKATATIYWVDARWQFPGPQRVEAGTIVDLVTRVTRAEGSLPARGWKVRYEIMNPELATFAGTGGSSVVEVNVDDSGDARATLEPIAGTSGNAVIDVRVIRPGGTSDNMPDLTLGRGQSYVTWSSPQLEIRAGGPEVASYQIPFDIAANLRNPGDQDATGVKVELGFPAGVRIVSTDAFAKVYTNSIVWDIGTMPARQQLDLAVNLTSPSALNLTFRATGDNGLLAEDNVRVDIFRPALALRLSPAEDRVTAGEPVRFNIEVENTGDRPLNEVELEATGDNGMIHTETNERGVGNQKTDGPLNPGEIWSTNVTFVPTDSGQRCIDVVALAAGGQRAQAQACVIAINPAPPTPAITANLQVRDRMAVGDLLLATGRVTNSGEVPLTNVRASMAYDVQLIPRRATTDYPYVIDTPYVIAWNIPELAPGQTVILETEFEAQTEAAASQIVFSAESNEGARNSMSDRIQIFPGAPQNAPLTPGPVLPPATGAPSIPGGPGTPPPNPNAGRSTPIPGTNAPTRAGVLRLQVLQREISPRVGDLIPYAIAITNDTDLLDSQVQIHFDLPPGVIVERLVQTKSPELQGLSRSGNTIYFTEIKTMKPGETIDYELVLRSNQAQDFDLVLEAESRNVPNGIAVREPTTVSP
ncbi:DUF11 domain-containing protein [Rhodopirellula sp. JC740]|uniref:DUF11 domain-containing protein n=1 Tax=Rhodopirellula halodulae TaxID=2894198 RepID=A0ABS8NJT8_9BACT|nr:DUF11 domain-containing protein [Rhodopirellula sp. JC740]MCC9643063.1 DUF11 domain-containing protein [Rhodopirellula sp. JC740]